jgi:hypothetical protein
MKNYNLYKTWLDSIFLLNCVIKINFSKLEKNQKELIQQFHTKGF